MIDSQSFKQTMARFASGITVLSWYEGEAVQGITVSAFSSVSLEPPLVLFCIDHGAYVHPLICNKDIVSINILSSTQTDLAYQFAGPDRTNLEARISEHAEHGLPVINDAHASFVVRIRDQHRQGDHDIFVAEVIDTTLNPESEPLLYHNGKIFSI